jgi:four helix bundle protein
MRQEFAEGSRSLPADSSASVMEVESHLRVATDLGYLPPQASQHDIAEIQAIQRMLGGLMRRLP